MISCELEQMFNQELDSLHEAVLALSKDGQYLRDKIKELCQADKSVSAVKDIAKSVATASYDHSIADRVNKNIARLGKTYIPDIIRNKVPIKIVAAKLNTSDWHMLYKDKLYKFTLQYDDSGVRLALFNEYNLNRYSYPKDIIEYVLSIAKPEHDISFNKSNIKIGFIGESFSGDKESCSKVVNYIDNKYKLKLIATTNGTSGTVRIRKVHFK